MMGLSPVTASWSPQESKRSIMLPHEEACGVKWIMGATKNSAA
jgi:hypothetical protein